MSYTLNASSEQQAKDLLRHVSRRAAMIGVLCLSAAMCLSTTTHASEKPLAFPGGVHFSIGIDSHQPGNISAIGQGRLVRQVASVIGKRFAEARVGSFLIWRVGTGRLMIQVSGTQDNDRIKKLILSPSDNLPAKIMLQDVRTVGAATISPAVIEGGVVMQVRFGKAVEPDQVRARLRKLKLGDVSVQRFGKSNDFLIRVQDNKRGAKGRQQAIADIKSALGSSAQFRRIELCGPIIAISVV